MTNIEATVLDILNAALEVVLGDVRWARQK